MRTKLFGAFIAALAITAFAALPSAASAENVTLKEGSANLEVGTTVRATSTDTTFTGRESGNVVACATTSIRGQVRKNPGARITFRNGGRFDNAAGGDLCKVEGPPAGRITARVEDVRFRKDINLRKRVGTTHITGRTEARFTFRFFDPTRAGETPIAGCNYHAKIEVRSEVGSSVFHAETEEDAILEEGSFGACDKEGALRGNFTLTRRDGTTLVKTN
jgi:hypothetical protein